MRLNSVIGHRKAPVTNTLLGVGPGGSGRKSEMRRADIVRGSIVKGKLLEVDGREDTEEEKE